MNFILCGVSFFFFSPAILSTWRSAFFFAIHLQRSFYSDANSFLKCCPQPVSFLPETSRSNGPFPFRLLATKEEKELNLSLRLRAVCICFSGREEV